MAALIGEVLADSTGQRVINEIQLQNAAFTFRTDKGNSRVVRGNLSEPNLKVISNENSVIRSDEPLIDQLSGFDESTFLNRLFSIPASPCTTAPTAHDRLSFLLNVYFGYPAFSVYFRHCSDL